jgi:germination protein M
MAVMMFFLSSCGLGDFFNKSEAVNNNVDVNSNVINPTATPASGAADDSIKVADTGRVVAVTPAPEGENRSGEVNDELVPAVVIGGIPDDTWVEDGFTPVYLYLRDNGGFVIPVTQKAVSQPNIAKLTLSKLIDDSVNREELAQYGLYPTIPKGTEILSFTVTNGIASVDFTSNFLNYKTDLDERVMLSSIVYTLTQFPTVTGVKLLCSGKKLPVMRFGSDASGILYRANTLINGDKLNAASGLIKQDVYVFRNSDYSIAYSLPISLEYEGENVGTDFNKTIELLADVNKAGVASLLPYGTKLIGTKLDKSTITLNFSRDLLRYAGNMREEAILRQLLYTFSQYKGISNLKIIIDGNESSVLPEGTDLSESIRISKALNLVLD